MKIFLQNLKYEYEIHMIINIFKKTQCDFFDISAYENDMLCDFIAVLKTIDENELDSSKKNISCISKIGENSYKFHENCLDEKKLKTATKDLFIKYCLRNLIDSSLGAY